MKKLGVVGFHQKRPGTMKAHTVRAENITELILERASPVIFETFFTGINKFQTHSSNLSWSSKNKPENYWKR